MAGPFMKQSPIAAKFLLQKGFNALGVLKGGINYWRETDYPLVRKNEISELWRSVQ